MKLRSAVSILLFASIAGALSAQGSPAWHDPSPHKVQFVTVDKDVELEVLDWGGTGRAIVLLQGLGGTAHGYDDFAPKLTPEYHVYGITRRGYGASSVPATGYSADRMGDDVAEVLDALKIEKPVLVGESYAGAELSSVANRHSERIAGAVYLEAGFSYALYDPSRGEFFDTVIDWNEAKGKMEQILAAQFGKPAEEQSMIAELLKMNLPATERDLQQLQKEIATFPRPIALPDPTAADKESFAALAAFQKRVYEMAMPEAELRQLFESTPEGHVGAARENMQVFQQVINGMQKYTQIPVPVLAIFAIPHDVAPSAKTNAEYVAAFEAWDTARSEPMAKAFEKYVPSARVVRLPHANHVIYISNEDDVLREIRAFITGLK